MNPSQLHIDFNPPEPKMIVTHIRENNSESELQLKKHRARWSEQNKKVFNLLMEGKSLTVLLGITKYGIGDLRRRIADCKELGIKIHDEYMASTSKRWWMDKEDQQFNKMYYGEYLTRE